MAHMLLTEKNDTLQMENHASSAISARGLRQRLPFRLAGVVIPLVLLLTTLLRLENIRDTRVEDNDASDHNAGKAPSAIFRWDAITPSTRMNYHPCFDGFQCARLEVPMDWRGDGSGRKMAIAVVRLPAVVPVTDPRYGGPIVTNPGGPGGSGVEQILRAGKMTQYIADHDIEPNATSSESSSSNIYHDIISFDPRGIGFTTPPIECFPDSLSRQIWNAANEALGLLGSSEDSFARNWYRARALAQGCSEANGASPDGFEALAEHVNTVPVVRDILEIIERHAEWVAEQSSQAQTSQDYLPGLDGAQTLLKGTTWSAGQVKLKYWGNSYGTVIGQTFASMYPDRVERLVLDGVVRADHYYKGPWFSNVQDADSILDKFFEYCAAAGPLVCRYYSDGGPEAIRAKFEQLLLDIFNKPKGVPGSATRGPDVITWSDIKVMVRYGMYLPSAYFPIIAELLADITRGNGSLMADFKQSKHVSSCPTLECQIAGPYSPECNIAADSNDASLAILCSDLNNSGFSDIDEETFQEYWHALQKQSKVLGDWWAHTRLGCVGWKTEPKWSFSGQLSVNTSYPILFVNPTRDPVTPLANAKAMAEHYPGSVVLEQTFEGHSSWSSPSLCTAKAVRAYFQTGTLPPTGAKCQPDEKPFGLRVTGTSTREEGDDKLQKAMYIVGKSIMDVQLWKRSRV